MSDGGHTPAAGAERLSRATGVMAVGTVLSRLTGFGRLFVLAYAFGFTRLTDTYNLANTTPNIVYELVVGGVLSGTLVPVFVRHLRPDEKPDTGRDAISAIVTVAAVAITGLAIALAVAAPWVIRLYTLGAHGPEVAQQREVATTLLRLFAPQVACLGAITVTTALLNARRRFAAPMYAPILANLVIIGALVATARVTDDLSLAGLQRRSGALLLLGLGTTAGFAVQALVQAGALRGSGLHLRLRWDLRNPAVRQVVRLSGWTVGFTVANQVALWVVLLLANRREGGVSAYQAGLVFFQLPHAVIAVSVMTALLPELSDRWHSGDRARFAADVGWGLRTVAAVMVPAAAGLALLARPLISLVLEHGALARPDARLTADVLALLALGLPGYSAYLLLVRAYFAMQDTRSAFWLYVVENGVNIALALVLFPALGVRGLAAAFAAAYTVAAAVAAAHLSRRLGTSALAGSAGTATRVGLATAAMAVVVVVVSVGLPADGGLGALVQVGVAAGAGVSVYLLAAMRLGVDELAHLLRIRRRST